MGDLHHIVTGGPRELAREARRRALLEAAEAVFAEHGFAGARVAMIASRAGYSAGNVYNSFEGKEDLFRALVAWRGGEALTAISTVLEETADAPVAELLQRFVDASFAFWSERPAFFRIYEDVTHGLEWNEEHFTGDGATPVREELESRFEARLARAAKRGEIAPGDCGLFTVLVFGTLNRAIARSMRDGNTPESLGPLRDEVLCLLERALGVRRETQT